MTMVVTGLGAYLPGDAPLAGEPAEAARQVVDQRPVREWFDVVARLGKRGYKYLPAASQLAVAAGRRALAEAGDQPLDAADPASRAVWVGTAATAGVVHAPLDRVVRESHSDLLSPAAAPYFSVNLVAGRLSTDVAAQGITTTITTPSTAALDALTAALAAEARSRSEIALVVGVEMPAEPDSPAFDGTDSGAVALVLERAERAQARGVPSLGRLQVHRGRWQAGTATEDVRGIAAAALATQGGPEVAASTLLVSGDAEPVLDTGMLRQFLPALTVGPVSAGAVAPLAAVAAALRGTRPHLVVVAGVLGHLAAVLVLPGPTDALELP